MLDLLEKIERLTDQIQHKTDVEKLLTEKKELQSLYIALGKTMFEKITTTRGEKVKLFDDLFWQLSFREEFDFNYFKQTLNRLKKVILY